MNNKGKLIANLKKTIGEDKWLVISGIGTVAALTAASALPKALALYKSRE
ncbi:MAG TPA: hypothetical protein VN703_01385 [Candidatus Sulfopaludibacter sp.]|nr:hypothetical protein [Candidatus Sulfopaludibacter sp.]